MNDLNAAGYELEHWTPFRALQLATEEVNRTRDDLNKAKRRHREAMQALQQYEAAMAETRRLSTYVQSIKVRVLTIVSQVVPEVRSKNLSLQ